MKVLFVENHATFAQQAARQFLGGHDVDIVPSFAAALAAVETKVYDVLLVDYDLDDGKGDAFVKRIRSDGSRTPIVAVSATDEGNAALLAAGANAICAKLKFSRIAEVLREVTAKLE